MTISERVYNIQTSQTMMVAARAIELKSEGKSVIDLSVGEPDFPTPMNVKRAAIAAIENNKTKYTLNVGTVELRKAIQSKLINENGLNYGLNEIIVSNGAKQSIYNALQSIVYTDDEVIIPGPYWVSYPEMVTMAHGVPVKVETTPQNNFKITAEQLRHVITPRTKAFILCSPSNPTGAAYDKEELEELAGVCEEHSFWIIADEIYEKLVYDDFKFTSFAAISEKLKERTILINGVSKSYAMTGWRIGYAAGPEILIKAMSKIQSHSTSNASSISQAAAEEALLNSHEEIESMRRELEKRRNFFYECLTEIPGISCYKSRGAFYLFPDVSRFFGKKAGGRTINSSVDFAMYLIDEHLIAAVPGSAFGAEGFLRFSYATSIENLKEAVNRLKEAVSILS